MTYPPPLYHGEDGEISATFRPDDAKPELVYPNGTRVHYLSTGESTGGLFGLYRWECGPDVTGPDPHFHRSLTESFYILSGTVRLFDGDRWVDATAGDFLYVPVGGVHAFRNESGERAEMLLLFAPGAPRETYFESLVERAAAGIQLTPEERIEFLRTHDQYNA